MPSSSSIILLLISIFSITGLFYFSTSSSTATSSSSSKPLITSSAASSTSSGENYHQTEFNDDSSSPSTMTFAMMKKEITVIPSHHHDDREHSATTGIISSPTPLPQSISDFKRIMSQFDLFNDKLFPLATGATNEPFQPYYHNSSSSSLLLLCPNPSLTSPNDDQYQGCRLPGINNVLYTQHARWFCISAQQKMKQRQNPYIFRDRFCNKGTAEKMRYSSILQIRYDKILLSTTDKTSESTTPSCDNDENDNYLSKNCIKGEIETIANRYRNERYVHHLTNNKNSFACWSDITNDKQLAIPGCGWMDVPSFYFSPQYWKARRLIDFHARYYIVGKVIAKMLFGSDSVGKADKKKKKASPSSSFISVHLRRGDYYQHCAKVKMGKKVKEWVTFSKSPAAESSLFAPSKSKNMNNKNTIIKLQPVKDPYQTPHNQTIVGCYPSLLDIEHAFDEVSKRTGIRNIFIATNTPQDLKDFGIIVDERNEKSNKKLIRKRNRKWRAAVLPSGMSELFFQNARKVDDVILEMVMLSMGDFFILNRFSSFSANALEMAIIHDKVKEDPKEWENVVTW